MGRPIKSTFIGNTATAGNQLTISAWVLGDSQARTGFITKQKGTRKYMAQTTDGDNIFVNSVDLTNNAIAAAGQAAIAVTPYGASGSGAAGNATVGLYSTVIVTDGTGSDTADYVPGELLTVVGGTNTAVATVRVNSVHARIANAAAGGSGFTVGDRLSFTSANYLFPMVLTVATTTGNGAVATVNITSGGSYAASPVPTSPLAYTSAVTTNAGAAGATFNIGWGLNTVSPVAGGVFTAIPSNPISLIGSAAGTGGTVNGKWTVNGVVLSRGGTGYTGAPAVTFSGGTPTTNAQAIATLLNSNVSVVSIYAGGNYATIPSVAFANTAATEYAMKIEDHTVTTWSGNVYTWYASGTTLTVANSATLPVA
jgi:hypothetical protein